MKSATFLWQWDAHDPQPDNLMTRDRAAKLIRAWRKASIQGRRLFELKRERRDGFRVYRVAHTRFDDNGALWLKA